MNGLSLVASVLYCIWYCYCYRPRRHYTRFTDFRVYYNAAKENYTWKPASYDEASSFYGWLYPNYVRYFWKPFLLVSEETASKIWFVISLSCWIVLAIFVCQLPFGWLLVLAFTKLVAVILWSGNCSVILSTLCLNPIGSLVASAVKLYLIPFIYLSTHAEAILSWLSKGS